MEQIFSKEIADEFMIFKGEVRGVSLKNYADFIVKKDGEEGLKKVENALAEVGYPIKYRELATMDFYPLGFQALSIAAMQKFLNYDEKTFYELGSFQPKISLMIKIFLKYFFSIDMLAKKVPDMWKKSYTVGELKVAELDKGKRHMILRLENFPCHPIQCHQTLRGYFPSVLKMVLGAEPTCEETKCVFRGDKYHEYLLKW